MKIDQIISILIFVLLSSGLPVFSQQQGVVRASITEIKNDPLKYDGKVVRINGIFESSHTGVGLESEDGKDGIRIVSPDAIGFPGLVQKDVLFKKFWEMKTDREDPDPDRVDIEVELDGLVRVLKVNGKVAEEFNVYGQWPVEVISVRIIKICSRAKEKTQG